MRRVEANLMMRNDREVARVIDHSRPQTLRLSAGSSLLLLSLLNVCLSNAAFGQQFDQPEPRSHREQLPAITEPESDYAPKQPRDPRLKAIIGSNPTLRRATQDGARRMSQFDNSTASPEAALPEAELQQVETAAPVRRVQTASSRAGTGRTSGIQRVNYESSSEVTASAESLNTPSGAGHRPATSAAEMTPTEKMKAALFGSTSELGSESSLTPDRLEIDRSTNVRIQQTPTAEADATNTAAPFLDLTGTSAPKTSDDDDSAAIGERGIELSIETSPRDVILRAVAWVVIALCLFSLAALGVRRWQRHKGLLPTNGATSRVIETLSLGPGRAVSLIEMAGYRALVAFDAGGIKQLVLTPPSFQEELNQTEEDHEEEEISNSVSEKSQTAPTNQLLMSQL